MGRLQFFVRGGGSARQLLLRLTEAELLARRDCVSVKNSAPRNTVFISYCCLLAMGFVDDTLTFNCSAFLFFLFSASDVAESNCEVQGGWRRCNRDIYLLEWT
jgi:hypothetical protein